MSGQGLHRPDHRQTQADTGGSGILSFPSEHVCMCVFSTVSQNTRWKAGRKECMDVAVIRDKLIPDM